MKKTSNSLRAERLARGLTQQEMADMLGVAKNYIYLLESGRKPISAAILAKLDNLPNPNPHTLPVVRDAAAAYGCRYPPECDLPEALSRLDGRMGELESSIETIKTQVQTLLGLLGAPLRERYTDADGHGQGQARTRSAG